MKAIVKPSGIRGNVIAPASKSVMQRACAAALIRGGATLLSNPGVSADDHAALDIIKQLGASVESREDKILIKSPGVRPVSNKIDCGESGLSVRMFTPIAAIGAEEIIIGGSGSLVRRPLAFFDEVLPKLGVVCQSNNGLLPLKIRGPLTPADVEVDGSLSSQFLTGLLFAFAAAHASDVTISVKDLNSKPYIDLTLQLMTDFGLKTPIHEEYRRFYFSKQSISKFENNGIAYTVEGDWSGAAFLLVAGAINSSGKAVRVYGLDVFSAQADRAILQALMQANTSLSITEEYVEVRPGKLKAFQFNATNSPDLFPPLATLAIFCEGKSVIEGVHRLTHKESNRASTLQEEFAKMGIQITLQDDLMVIDGDSTPSGAFVSSHHDHRIAMACAIAALNAENAVEIEQADAVNKSYPSFWNDMVKLGAAVFLQD